MITVQAQRSFDPEEWRQLVVGCNGNALHLPDVHCVEHDPDELLYLVFVRGGEVVACAVAIVQSRKVLKLGVGPKTLDLPTSPAMREASVAPDVYAELVRFATQEGFVRLVIEPHWGDRLDTSDLFAKHVIGGIVEFVVDLAVEPSRLLERMHKVHRKNIRRARACGLTLEEDDSPAGLLRLRDLQLESARRLASRGEGQAFEVRDPSYFRRAFEKVYSVGIGHVLFAKSGEEHVAGLAYLVGGRRGITVRSGSLEKGYETRAMYLLQYELLERARAGGLLELNLGGVPREAEEPGHPQWGLYEFKKGFGGTPCLRNGIRMPLR